MLDTFTYSQEGQLINKTGQTNSFDTRHRLTTHVTNQGTNADLSYHYNTEKTRLLETKDQTNNANTTVDIFTYNQEGELITKTGQTNSFNTRHRLTTHITNQGTKT